MIRSYIAVDLETTGLRPKEDRITEIAALKVIEGNIQGEWVSLINPGCRLDPRIVELTGITDSMLENAPAIDEVLESFLEFTEDLPLLGHNIQCDYSFLKQAALNARLPFERQGIDTLYLCRTFMPAEERKNLASACTFYQIPQLQAHRARADALNAHLLYQEMISRYAEVKEEAFGAKSLIYKGKRSQPATKRQKQYLQDLAKYHRIDLTVQVEFLSRSQASRLINQILVQYGRPEKIKEVNLQ